METDLETRIHKTGTGLHQMMGEGTPSFFHRAYWTSKMLEWCMQNESFKTELFRFVDVFPSLSRPETIAGHLHEYFSRPGLDLPRPVRKILEYTSPSTPTGKLIAGRVARVLSTMAGQFMVGESPKKVLGVLERMRSHGIAFTVDLLGEAVVSEAEAGEYVHRYLEWIELLDRVQKDWKPLGTSGGDLDWGRSPRINLSIKTSALYSQMNPCSFEHSVHMAKGRLRPIVHRVMRAGGSITLDMEQVALKNLTLALYRSLREEPEVREYPHTGIVIQSYLRDSEQDLRSILDWAREKDFRLTIRLVKGAYWDSEVITARQNNWPIPVFTRKHETDANFEKLARIILENHQWVTLACASHNLRSIACVMETARELRVPEDRMEFQLLYGMGESIQRALSRAGVPLRLYSPVGNLVQGMAYFVRRLLENTANESFLRLSFAEGVPMEDLLKNPRDLAGEGGTHAPAPWELPAFEPVEDRWPPFENEPPLDWTREENRNGFRAALDRVRKSFPREVPLFIGGHYVETERKILSVNPNDPEEIVGEVSSGGRDEGERAVRAARGSFPGWRDTDPVVRAGFLFRAAAQTRKRRLELAALQVFEVGKSWTEADADVCEAVDFLEYYGREMIRLATPRRMGRVPGELSHLWYEPRGVAAVIAPWNFPLAISMGMTSAAVVTGNPVVYKPASQSPVIGSMIAEIFREADLPPGVFNFVPGPGSELGDVLATHPDVALVAFTGSKAVGLEIIEKAARVPAGSACVKNVIAEMGGKNAVIVDADADLDEAVVHIVRSAFGYQGQKCSACSRLIVLEENCERLLERLKAAVQSLHLGPPEDPKNFVGAVIEPTARERILDYIEIGTVEAKLFLRRDLEGARGFFAPIAVFTEVNPRSPLAREEIFGPVLAVLRVKDFEEALRVANSTPYALTGAVFSRSPRNIERARKAFRTGNLYINRGCTGAVVGRHPFGGFGLSGVGSKAGGPDYLLQFMVPKNACENIVRRGFAPW